VVTQLEMVNWKMKEVKMEVVTEGEVVQEEI
jgi:hypothetical protein